MAAPSERTIPIKLNFVDAHCETYRNIMSNNPSKSQLTVAAMRALNIGKIIGYIPESYAALKENFQVKTS
jgi:hypothetical protein